MYRAESGWQSKFDVVIVMWFSTDFWWFQGNFDLLDSTYIVGYLSNATLLGSKYKFHQLITGAGWLVREWVSPLSIHTDCYIILLPLPYYSGEVWIETSAKLENTSVLLRILLQVSGRGLGSTDCVCWPLKVQVGLPTPAVGGTVSTPVSWVALHGL